MEDGSLGGRWVRGEKLESGGEVGRRVVGELRTDVWMGRTSV